MTALTKEGALKEASCLIKSFDLEKGHYKQTPRGKGNFTYSKAQGRPFDIKIADRCGGNQIFLGAEVSGRLQINIQGSRNLIYIGDRCDFGSSIINIRNDDTVVCFGEGSTTTGDCRFAVGQNAPPGTGHLLIGDDAMFAKSTAVFTSDNHPILDSNTYDAVPPKENSVIIEPHVWIGEGSKILKGCRIGCGAIIGAGSLVTTQVARMTIAAGVPAREIAKERTWARNNSAQSKEAAERVTRPYIDRQDA